MHLETIALNIGLGIINLFFYILVRYVKYIDIVFLGFLSFFAPRLTGFALLNTYYDTCDNLINLLGSKIVAFVIVCASMYLIYLLAWFITKKTSRRKDLSDILKYIIAFPVCFITSIALWRFAWTITTDDADAAHVFFIIVIIFILTIHYVSFIYHDFLEKPLCKYLLPHYEKKLGKLLQKRIALEKEESRLQYKLDSCKHK